MRKRRERDTSEGEWSAEVLSGEMRGRDKNEKKIETVSEGVMKTCINSVCVRCEKSVVSMCRNLVGGTCVWTVK